MHSKIIMTAVASAAAAIGAAGLSTVIASGAQGSAKSHYRRAPHHVQKTKAARVDPALRRSFKVLRRKALRAHSATVSDGVQSARTSALAAQFGANVALARAADIPGTDQSALVIPGNNAVCLWVPVDGSWGGTCGSTASAQRAGLIAQVFDGANSQVIALIPDAAHGGAIRTRDGATVSLAVNGSVGAAKVAAAQAVTIGDVTTPLTVK